MVVRKTLAQAKAEKGYVDEDRFDGFSDADIDRLIAEDPDLAPPTEGLTRLLDIRDIRHKLGLTQKQFALKLGVSPAMLHLWEQGPGRTDPAMQALLRILDSAPEMALRALDEPARKAG
jgi:DNA-binding transcriptional regulator YiaG